MSDVERRKLLGVAGKATLAAGLVAAGAVRCAPAEASGAAPLTVESAAAMDFDTWMAPEDFPEAATLAQLADRLAGAHELYVRICTMKKSHLVAAIRLMKRTEGEDAVMGWFDELADHEKLADALSRITKAVFNRWMIACATVAQAEEGGA